MVKNIIKILFSNAVLTIIGLVNSFIFPIILNINDYSHYQEYILYISYTNICHLGIASGMFLNYAGQNYRNINKKQYKSEILLLYIVLCSFTVIGLAISGATKSEMMFYVVLTIIPQCLIASFLSLYQAWERFTGYSIFNALPKLLFTLFTVLSFCVMGKINGNTVVISYLVIQWIIAIYFIFEFFKDTKGIKTNKIFSIENKKTTINGFLITLGNYVNLLFHSIDKQFVHIIYSTFSFAQYSFAMSTQNIMTLFITALANPFYPRLAKEDIDSTYILRTKEALFVFGSLSGCAYFGVSFIVRHYIVKYVDSLGVVAMFFAVFPAMAVINVLYINMYKIKRMFKRYIFSLIGMLVVSIILNGISVLLKTDYIGISFATMISYYIWLFYSQRDFDDITISLKDIIYLIGFFLLYFFSVIVISNSIVGFSLYLIFIIIWDYFTYKDSVLYVFKTIRKNS